MVNKVILVARLGQDPILKTFGNTTLCELRVVTEKGRGDDKKVEWHTVKCFGVLAEQCNKFLKSGRMVFVLGEINSRMVNDKKYTDINASEIQFL